MKAEGFPKAYLLPALILAALVWGLPLIYALLLSFTQATPGGTGDFIGLANYLTAFRDPGFFKSASVSALFASCASILNVGAGLIIALLLRPSARASAYARSALLFPWVLSELAVALIFSGFCHESSGLVNITFMKFGLPRVLFQSGAAAATGLLLAANLWRGLAFSAMLQMAGLASLPRNLIDAARVDGAKFPQIFRRVIWPHQSRIVAVNLLLVFLHSLIIFALPFALTGGGPLGATRYLSLYAYDTAFGGDFSLGYAAAQGMIVLAAYGLLMSLLFRLRKRAAS